MLLATMEKFPAPIPGPGTGTGTFTGIQGHALVDRTDAVTLAT